MRKLKRIATLVLDNILSIAFTQFGAFVIMFESTRSMFIGVWEIIREKNDEAKKSCEG